ncbi:MAG: hypothetical protein GY796_31000 [Chloroflexi bacterium]|nr:hypothetical protein [Chloroflexota bacterium]
MSEVTPPQLHKFLIEYFSLGELRTMCFELSIPYEDLGGDGKSAKALSLVQYAQRRGQYDTVVSHVQAQRPTISIADGTGDTAVTPTDQSSEQSSTPGTGDTYHITVQGNLVGSTIGGGEVNAEQIAGGNIEINNRDDFKQQLQLLERLIKQAIDNGELTDSRDAEDALTDVQEIVAEVEDEQPRTRRMSRNLEGIIEILDKAGQVATSAGKVGTAVLKAAPIAAALAKAVFIFI